MNDWFKGDGAIIPDGISNDHQSSMLHWERKIFTMYYVLADKSLDNKLKMVIEWDIKVNEIFNIKQDIEEKPEEKKNIDLEEVAKKVLGSSKPEQLKVLSLFAL